MILDNQEFQQLIADKLDIELTRIQISFQSVEKRLKKALIKKDFAKVKDRKDLMQNWYNLQHIHTE